MRGKDKYYGFFSSLLQALLKPWLVASTIFVSLAYNSTKNFVYHVWKYVITPDEAVANNMSF